MLDFLPDLVLGALAMFARIAIGAPGVAAGVLAGGYRRFFSSSDQTRRHHAQPINHR